MIALGILTTWLLLTAAGFAGLSALRRAGVREDAELYATAPSELPGSMLAHATTRVAIPKALLR